MVKGQRNNSWDAIWEDASSGLKVLGVVIAFGLLFISWKALLIYLGFVLFFWVMSKG